MIRFENECVGCPPERGCIGSACPYVNVPRCYCDDCGEEISQDSPRFNIDAEFHFCEKCDPDDEEEY